MRKEDKGSVLSTIFWAERQDPFFPLESQDFSSVLGVPLHVIPWSDPACPEYL